MTATHRRTYWTPHSPFERYTKRYMPYSRADCPWKPHVTSRGKNQLLSLPHLWRNFLTCSSDKIFQITHLFLRCFFFPFFTNPISWHALHFFVTHVMSPVGCVFSFPLFVAQEEWQWPRSCGFSYFSIRLPPRIRIFCNFFFFERPYGLGHSDRYM